MIVLRKGPLRIGEVWFDEEPRERVDVLRYQQRSRRVSGGEFSEFATLLVDLARTEDEIFAAVKKGTKYQIRRAAERDGLTYTSHVGRAAAPVVARFVDFFRAFAAVKGLDPVDPRLLHAYSAAGALDLSVVGQSDGTELVWHGHYRSPERGRLLYSASYYRDSADSAHRNFVGRANRWHHWRDIQRFKAEGLALYDFGGFYLGDTDEEKLRINLFKEEFGGVVARSFNGEKAATLRGRLFLGARQLVKRVPLLESTVRNISGRFVKS